MEHITILPAAQATVDEAPWGRLTWFASRALGNAAELTAGLCEINPGCANPRHQHPNCEEVLHVLSGTIAHTADGGSEVVLAAGDTITIPAGTPHNARNLGEQPAALSLCFSSADRKTIGE